MALTLKEPYLALDNGSVAGCYNRSVANAVGVKMKEEALHRRIRKSKLMSHKEQAEEQHVGKEMSRLWIKLLTSSKVWAKINYYTANVQTDRQPHTHQHRQPLPLMGE